MKVRLQKVLAEAGVASRRKCEELITSGHVTVDGRVANLGQSVDPETAKVRVDGVLVGAEEKEYWLLNKPVGVLSAAKDARARRLVTDLVPTSARIYPVGRLDLDSSGLMLLTNDGALSEMLLHPRYHVEKEYVVTIKGALEKRAADQIRRGIQLEEGVTSPARLTVVDSPTSRNDHISTVRVIIHEGRKRQVRRMFAAVGKKVLTLHRSRFAVLTDENLSPGQARRLTEKEVGELIRLAGLS